MGVIGVGRENQHFRRCCGLLDDSPGGIDAIEQRHRDVQNHDGGTKRPGHLHRLQAIGSLANHVEVIGEFQDRPKSFPDKRMVISQQNGDFCHYMSIS